MLGPSKDSGSAYRGSNPCLPAIHSEGFPDIPPSAPPTTNTSISIGSISNVSQPTTRTPQAVSDQRGAAAAVLAGLHDAFVTELPGGRADGFTDGVRGGPLK